MNLRTGPKAKETKKGAILTLIYPAYIYWPDAQTFYQITSKADLEASFAWNDVKKGRLTGWDSRGYRFSLGWDDILGHAVARTDGPDFEGLATTAHLFYSQRKGEEKRFAQEDVVDGECSLRAIRRFCEAVLLRPGQL